MAKVLINVTEPYWAKVDPDLCHHMATQGHSVLRHVCHSNKSHQSHNHHKYMEYIHMLQYTCC